MEHVVSTSRITVDLNRLAGAPLCATFGFRLRV
jgi:hypothetical protein